MTSSLSTQEQALIPAIEQWIEQHREQLIEDLASWIEIPSISRADRGVEGAPFGAECQQILERALTLAQQAGFTTENHQGYAGSVIYGNHAKDIGLIGHLDVVPPGDNWLYPPFTLTRKGEFVIGRGVADNKGPAIADLYLLKLIRDLNIPLSHNLRIVYGLAEETNMADLAWYSQHGPVPEVSIVTDGRFPVNNAQKGQITLHLAAPVSPLLANFSAGIASNSVPERASIELPDGDFSAVNERIATLSGLSAGRLTAEPLTSGLRLNAEGIAGHAAFPEGTLSAVRVLFSALLELKLVNDHDRPLITFFERFLRSPFGEQAGIAFADEESGKLTFNAGIWSGDAANNTLNITLDIRYPVLTRAEQVLAALQETVAPQGITLTSWRDVPPFYLPVDDRRIQLLQQTWNDLSGRDDKPYAMGGVTHSKVLPRAITFGPGYARTPETSPDFLPAGHGLPHGADEVVHIPSLLAALPVYVIALIRLDRWLQSQS
ncbi:Sapep family Mn(2+)-dependent dipeptidase [Winslowiella iniecta]|uniref:Peptidase M20 n=1 Tax=Winslowiella iniecta TaxID=1560201 RepID=A0A0L7TEV0_9GAMM|nr:Sapep family Mn(2+)-dependent dipeptidase [Winslowiella iniecta]KOC89573.1 peptidase M20 [Winslowiella iniecta]KOC93873.1 peptidase M20 [Winslowiella iniecta]